MHKAKERIAKAAERIQGMERAKLIVACAITIASAIIVITITLLVLNMQPGTPNTTGVVLSGEIACLPHKVTEGPQTLECALGLKTDDSRYYALKGASQSDTSPVGARVNVHGTLSTATDATYDIVGTIAVTSITP